MTRRKIIVGDLLCGAGGTTTGIVRALLEMGWTLEQIIIACVNHWPVAIETHTRNYPTARHYVQDIATARPIEIVPEGYLDILAASPTCTHHSVARGGKPTSDQQRSDPWHVITWLTELRVKRLIIENVWEFTGWGPVDPRTGRPLKSRKGDYFRAWIKTIRGLGYEPEWRKLNAANYGEATTRQRFILKARYDRVSIGWAPLTHAPRMDDAAELFPTLKPWRPAREIIDWSIKGKSIFRRKKPLAPKTLARIYAGMVKFNWPEPFLIVMRQHMAAQGLDKPLPTLTARGTHIGLIQPVIVRTDMQGRKSPGARGAGDPLPTLTTHSGIAIVTPIILSQQNSGAPRSADDPLATITTGGAGTGKHQGCARHMLVEPFVLSRQSEGAPRTVGEPMPTTTTKHAPVLISPYYGSGSGETCTSDEQPLPTITAKPRFGMVVPVTHSHDRSRARDIEAPLPTLTTAKGGEYALVIPVTHASGFDRVLDPSTSPLPTVTGANRGELAFITAQHGERPGQAPRVHGVDAPAPTIAATGHVDLVEGGEGYDILFRMLEPHELAAAMGFITDDETYDFAGTKTEQVKQIGNAVSVHMMKAEIKAFMADAAPTKSTEPLAIAAEWRNGRRATDPRVSK